MGQASGKNDGSGMDFTPIFLSEFAFAN